MYIVPILPITLDLIKELNNGLRPTYEADTTAYFVYHEEAPAEIFSEDHPTMEEILSHSTHVSIRVA